MTVIVMAVWGRLPLVKVNLELLASQACEVVCVTSLQQDSDFIRALRLPYVHLTYEMNNPLGKKWQSGVEYARNLGAERVIILGSDDYLSTGFVAKAEALSRQHDFVYFDKWYIYDAKKCQSFALDYQMERYKKPPLGSGRVYSKRLLDRHSWQIFDTGRNNHLDNFIWDNHTTEDRKLMNPEGMAILAVKGHWETMNPVDVILSTETINWDTEKDIDRHFNFGKPIKEIFKNL